MEKKITGASALPRLSVLMFTWCIASLCVIFRLHGWKCTHIFWELWDASGFRKS